MRQTKSSPETTAQFQVRVRRNINRVQSLPALSNVVTKIISLADNPTVSGQQVADIVGKDQSMVTAILKIVNSPFYGLNRRVSSISQAIVLLGYRTIRNVALSTTLLSTFSGTARDRRFHRGRFWEHSVSTAAAAKLLARRLRLADVEEAFLAGLIHDMGRIIFDHYFTEEFTEVLDIAIEEKIPLIEAEKRVFGLDHAAVGRLIAKKWNFPPHVADAIGLHHRPEDAKVGSDLPRVVHLADALSRLSEQRKRLADGSNVRVDAVLYPSTLAPRETTDGSGDAEVPGVAQIDPRILAEADLDEDAIETILTDLDGELEKVRAFLNVLKG